jgi:hypothetical protein
MMSAFFDLKAGKVGEHRGAPRRAERLRRDLLAQFFSTGREIVSELAGPESSAPVRAGDDAVVTAPPPVRPAESGRGHHLVLGEQRILVESGVQFLAAGDQVIDGGTFPPGRPQIVRRQDAAKLDGLVDLDAGPAQGFGELLVIVSGGPARGQV